MGRYLYISSSMEQTEGSYGKCLDEERNFEVGDKAIVRRHKGIDVDNTCANDSGHST